jgi:TrmH family RNA methyltransferase
METITSAQNQRFKDAMRLHTSRGRQKQQRIVVFGYREVTRAIEAGVHFAEVMILPERLGDRRLNIPNSEDLPDTSIVSLAKPLFEKLAFGDRVDGVVGVTARPDTSLDKLAGRLRADRDHVNVAASVVLVVEAIEKPGNFGAIVRSADACGADALLIADPLTDVFHPNSIRSSVATVFSVPLACASSVEIQKWLVENDFQVLVGTPEAELSLYDQDLSGRIAFVVGNEAHGLSELWRAGNWRGAKLPMSGIGDSLNVSVTASLMMFEAKRQQRAKAANSGQSDTV